ICVLEASMSLWFKTLVSADHARTRQVERHFAAGRRRNERVERVGVRRGVFDRRAIEREGERALADRRGMARERRAVDRKMRVLLGELIDHLGPLARGGGETQERVVE